MGRNQPFEEPNPLRRYVFTISLMIFGRFLFCCVICCPITDLRSVNTVLMVGKPSVMQFRADNFF